MAGHKPFSNLTRKLSPESRARVAAKAAALQEQMTLEELRHARSLSQKEVAEAMDVLQPAVAKLEARTDMHVSNLRRYVEALGGELEINARFPEATVNIVEVGN
jgi:predicted transcriptional regulator